MAFDSNGNLYVTNFQIGSVSKFDYNGVLVNKNFITGQINPESISIPGGQFPALVGDAGAPFIKKYSSSGGIPLKSYPAQIEKKGTGLGLSYSPDRKTVLYTSEGTSILSYDITGNGKQLSPFATGLPGSPAVAFQVRLLTSGPFASYALVADNSDVRLVAPGSNGTFVKKYTFPSGNSRLFAVSPQS